MVTGSHHGSREFSSQRDHENAITPRVMLIETAAGLRLVYQTTFLCELET